MIPMRKTSLLGKIGLFVFIFAFKMPSVYGFSVNPGRADFTVTAGKECVKEFFITNSEEGAVYVKATLTDIMRIMPELKSKEGEGKVSLKNDYLLTKFSKIYPEKVLVGPNSIGKINLKINMPKDAKGEYYGSIFFESMPTEENKENTVSIANKIGMALYIAIEGTKIFKCEIGKYEILTAAPLSFRLNVKNSGNVHIRPEGYISFKRNKEGTELQVPLNTIYAPILPNTELDIGTKRTEFVLLPGEYTAFVHLEYGEGHVLNEELRFTVPEKK